MTDLAAQRCVFRSCSLRSRAARATASFGRYRVVPPVRSASEPAGIPDCGLCNVYSELVSAWLLICTKAIRIWSSACETEGSSCPSRP